MNKIICYIALNITNVQLVLLVIFLTYRITVGVVVVSLFLYNSFDLGTFLLDFNLSISDNFSNDILMCSPEDSDENLETIHVDSDDDSENIPGNSYNDAVASLPEDAGNSPLIVEVSIQKERLLGWFDHTDWTDRGDYYSKRYGSEDITITTDSNKYYSNQTVEVKNHKNDQVDFCSQVSVIKPSNADTEVIAGKTFLIETDKDSVLFKATITADTAITEVKGGNPETFHAEKMTIECDKNSCDISDRDIDRGKSFEFDSSD